MFRSPYLPDAFAQAFAEVPDEPIWQWADREVTLCNEDAAEPGPYRSAKTPWTRRIQEIAQAPFTWEWDRSKCEFVKVPVTEINIQKSSQSGVTESCLNVIRWRSKHRPCNVIYLIDTDTEAKKIARRLLRSLKLLDASIFTGDADDIKSTEFLLRGMELNFYGSFSSGKVANKFALLNIADEVEEHGQVSGDTSSLRNLASRGKTAEVGLQINLSKPKKDSGPIHRAFNRGNQEQFFIRCPHCDELQPLTFFPTSKKVPFSNKLIEIQDEQTGRVVFRGWEPLPPGETRELKTGQIYFEHCKDLLGNWDKLRILQDTYYECGYCKGKIEEWQKSALVAEGFWIGTAIGTPGIVSQHINDLYSEDKKSAWGLLVLEFLDANAEGATELQGFYNQRLGLTFADEVSKTESDDINSNIAGTAEGKGCPPYKRGTVPFKAVTLILGSDIGLNYGKWAVLAVHPNLEDVAVIDWGCELDPYAVAEVYLGTTWPGPDGAHFRVGTGFMDGKYKRTDVYKACIAVRNRRMIPCAGNGGTAARVQRAWSYGHIPGYPNWFCLLTFNDREAKDEMYVTRIKKKVRRIWFPVDVGEDSEFVAELCAEELIRTKKGYVVWKENPGANHYGDCVKLGVNGFRFLTRKTKTQPAAPDANTESKAETAAAV